MPTVLVVGAGISGSTLAERFANHGYNVTVIESRDHIAGNCYDYVNSQGILMNKYGAHIFHTNSQRVWDYVTRFSSWSPWIHRIKGRIGNTYFPVPVNIDTVNILCGEHIQNEEQMKEWLSKATIPTTTPANSEEVALARVGPTLYNAIFKDYTYKQWALYPKELEPSVLERIPVRTNHNADYFSDTYQALPTHGYTKFVQAMLDHPNITVRLNTEYSHDMKQHYDYVMYTGPIDAYYKSHNYPKLSYRSIKFVIEELDVDSFQEDTVVNYPSNEVSFTRIVEYKHFLNQNVPGKTTIVTEYTTGEGDPYYPIPTKENVEIYKKYQELAQQDEANGVYFIGRLANYKYYNMDAAIENALKFFDTFINAPPL